jgi:hypothetical protein
MERAQVAIKIVAINKLTLQFYRARLIEIARFLVGLKRVFKPGFKPVAARNKTIPDRLQRVGWETRQSRLAAL